MRNWLFTFLFLILANGCSTGKINHHPGVLQTKVFPNGVYYHEVTLDVKPGTPEQKKYTFDGVVRLSEDQIIVVALSFFGTTEFKITEDINSGKITSDIYRESLKKFEPQLKNLYSTLRRALLANAKDSPLLDIKFSKYDENKIPEEIEIEHPQFKVRVKIKRYEI